jgi:hypothetical protein
MTVDVARVTPFTALVRQALASLCFCVMLCGCTATPPGGTLSGSPDRVSPRPAFPAPASSEPERVAPAEPGVRMDRRVLGRIVSVNPALRFVVMDFPVWRMPALEQRLHVYRNEQKIGEVKVTGPTVDTTVAGDLVAGEARLGDEVRE